MASFEVPYFGQLNLESLEEYYSTETELNNVKIQLDLNFENKAADSAIMTAVKNLLENIPKLDQQNKIYIERDFNDKNGDSARFYLDFHLEEIGKQELLALLGLGDETAGLEDKLLAKLHLTRVGLYPDSEEIFAVFDYTIGREFTNYLIVVNLDRKCKLDYITVES